MNFFKSKIAWQLLLWLLLIEFPVESLLVYVSYHNSEQTLRTELTDKLRAIATYQIAEINQFVDEQFTNANTISQIPELIGIAEGLSAPAKVADLAALGKLQAQYQNTFQKYQNIFGFKELLLVAPKGNVLLSTNSALQANSNLLEGDLKNSELSKTFLRANTILQPDFSDFFYLPNQSELAAFVATPVRGETGKVIAVLMLRINLEKMNKAVQNYTGMGNSGEIVLATKMKNEVVFITPTRYQKADESLKRFFIEDLKEKGEGIRRAVEAETGFGVVLDYKGQEVFAHWHYIPALRSGIVIKEEVAEAFAPIKNLRNLLLIIVLCTLLLFVFAAFNIAAMFTKPIRKLNEVTKKIAAGDFSQKAEMKLNNEIGELAHSFDDMTTKVEAYQIELQKYNDDLERKVQERTEELNTLVEELSQTNEELHSTVDFVETQKSELVKKNENITASITYARRIQAAILPLHENISKVLKDFFIFYKPRDIVSGDFYWFADLKDSKCLLVAADCTGHGVPGALMSMIGVNLLNEIVYLLDIHSPELILEKMNAEISRVLQQSVTDNRDGMDLAITLIDLKNKQLSYAGAMNSVYYVQDNVLHELKSTRMGIGGTHIRQNLVFQKQVIDIATPTVLYMFSDGYADQIGGKENKKFMSRKFRELLFSVHGLKTEIQKESIALTLTEWMGEEVQQLDDIMVIGVKL
jgi:serine phosphatase RsbU (regulator of sigma subunit)